MSSLWDQLQDRALGQIAEAMADGYRKILITAPTGFGKTRLMQQVLGWGYPAALYTDRRLLLEQLHGRLGQSGFQMGIRASGWKHNVLPDIQLAMIQTEHSQVIDAESRRHHNARLVLFDEAHRLKADQAKALRELHIEDGATLIGLTATPVGLGAQVTIDEDGNETREDPLYDKLVVAATMSECRKVGALLPADHYAPSEPDMRGMEKHRMPTGDYSGSEMRKKFCRPVVFGSVLREWRRLNPDQEPTILFGPDVAGSKWFHDQFVEEGISAAHIDGEDVLINGEHFESTREVREELLGDFRRGEISILCNRFVLREGIDVPEIKHCIFATAMGSVTSYIQAGGRALRSHPSMDRITIQDHGGNWHRHGSLNSDREWRLDDTEKSIRQRRNGQLERKEQDEGIACPECFAIRREGKTCPNCGHVSHGKSRVVIQQDGTLKQMRGDIYKPRKTDTKPENEKDWINTLFQFANAKSRKTFNQAAAYYALEHNGLRPDPSWPFAPQDEMDGASHVTRAKISELGKRQAEQRRAQQDADSLFAGGNQ